MIIHIHIINILQVLLKSVFARRWILATVENVYSLSQVLDSGIFWQILLNVRAFFSKMNRIRR